jgi:hypothetical protein
MPSALAGREGTEAPLISANKQLFCAAFASYCLVDLGLEPRGHMTFTSTLSLASSPQRSRDLYKTLYKTLTLQPENDYVATMTDKREFEHNGVIVRWRTPSAPELLTEDFFKALGKPIPPEYADTG